MSTGGSLKKHSQRLPLVELRCDGGHEVGFGHLRRSQTLAAALKKRGFPVRVLPCSEEARSLNLAFPTDPGDAELLLFDLPDSRYGPLEAAVNQGLVTVALDYFGEHRPTLTISVRERATIPPGNRVSGFSYAIIRPEILALRGRPGNPSGGLITMGGADPGMLSSKVVHALRNCGEELTLVVGPYAQCEVQERKGLRIVYNPTDLPERMANCRFAVSSGGVTLGELLCLGKAVHVVPQTQAEDELANELLRLDAILGVGLATLSPPTYEQATNVGSRGAEVFDGNGVERIVDAVEGIWRKAQKQ